MLASIAVATLAFTGSIVAVPVGEPKHQRGGTCSGSHSVEHFKLLPETPETDHLCRYTRTAATPLDKRGSPFKDDLVGRIEGTNETEMGHVLFGPARNKPYIERQKELLIDEQSKLFLGGTDPSKYAGAITWAPLISKTWVTEGTLNVESTAAYTGRMIIHSDENLIVGSLETVKHWWSNVPGSEPCDTKFWNPVCYYTFPCSSPPSVGFNIGGKKFSVSPEDFNLGPTNNTGIACTGANVGFEAAPEDTWVVGGRFVKNLHTVFDEANSRVGLATLD
ncbi:unnamed protein product [Rhizoctonia solani]|uniref:Peptidase A1 domain-containing protein n=1 Tax=Rhizoctonia solani TaxID=456999 RepID=A0A8H2Y2I1_9AGAM|nr:unnamed protein product [Rhizoctonia solani]